jgi:hypothetical protein
MKRVPRFQTIHHHSVDVARGLVLLFGMRQRSIKEIVRTLSVSRAAVRKIIRGHKQAQAVGLFLTDALTANLTA